MTPPGEVPLALAATCGAVVFLVALGLAAAFTFAAPVLHDTDSYYHLAVGARVAAEGRLPATLPWARYSLLHDPFPDKEPLFHLLLAPFARGDDGSSAGGRLALALLIATLAGALAFLAAEQAGVTAALLALALPLLALDVADRLPRLRPELVALLLILLAARAAARRADRAVGGLVFAFASAYTAIHALLGLVGLWCLVRRRHDGRFPLALPLYATLGAALALLVHPAFPANLELWLVQNVHLFDLTTSLGAGGAELRPATTAELLTKNFAFWLVAALLLARRGAAPSPESPRALARDIYAVAGAVFFLLYLTMWRFGLYFYPLALLALVARAGPAPLAGSFRLGRRASLPVVVAVVLVALAALPPARGMAHRFLDRSMPGPPREAAWRAFGASVPNGARVAAPWGIAQAYVFFAPQGRYLNLLDPVFMALPFPREFELQRALFAGEEPDLAFAAGAGLDSDHLAFSVLSSPPRLVARAQGDPRLVPVHAGYDRLYRVESASAQAFRRDWEAAPVGGAGGPVALRPYPRSADPRARALEAFVDARRVGPACVRFLARESVEVAGERWFEFAPYGAGRLALDGGPVVGLAGAPGAVLGEGAMLRLELTAGERVWTVETCPDPATGRSGFFLLEREAPARPAETPRPGPAGVASTRGADGTLPDPTDP